MVLVAVASVPSARPLHPELYYPPKNFPGVVRGYQEPSGSRQTGTGQSTLEQDTPKEQEALRGRSSEAEASSVWA